MRRIWKGGSRVGRGGGGWGLRWKDGRRQHQPKPWIRGKAGAQCRQVARSHGDGRFMTRFHPWRGQLRITPHPPETPPTESTRTPLSPRCLSPAMGGEQVPCRHFHSHSEPASDPPSHPYCPVLFGFSSSRGRRLPDDATYTNNASASHPLPLPLPLRTATSTSHLERGKRARLAFFCGPEMRCRPATMFVSDTALCTSPQPCLFPMPTILRRWGLKSMRRSGCCWTRGRTRTRSRG